MNPLDTLLPMLSGVRDHGDYYTAKCPAHDDKHSSLSITLSDDGKVLIKCHAGCEFSQIIDSLGITASQLFSGNGKTKKSGGKVIAEYDYRDADGTLRYQVLRYEPKSFKQRRPDGHGNWIWGLSAGEYVQSKTGDWYKTGKTSKSHEIVKHFPECKPIPFRLPEVLEAIKSNRGIYIVEGEKDVLTLASYGLIATCNSGGAGKFPQQFAKYFKDAKICIIPDQDAPGLKHAEIVAKILSGSASKIVILNLDDAKDISDWFASGHSFEEFKKIVRSAIPWTPKPEPDDDIILPFRCLGFEAGYYYYLPNQTLQVTSFYASAHTPLNLLSLAPISWWESVFKPENKIDWTAAANFLFRKSETVGVYNFRLRRGRGAWFDDDRIVLHLGDHLVVDGVQTQIKDFKTRYIYESAPASEYSDFNPLTDSEAGKTIEIMQMLAWENPVSAYLLAGWCAIAPICGALVWRPHVFITGESGNGKSWVINNIVHQLIGDASIKIMGNTSEAAIRRSLRIDGIPVVYDEAKRSSSQSARERMQAVLELARAGSSESENTMRMCDKVNGIDEFIIRSCFLFGAVSAPIKLGEDDNRITILELSKHKTDKVEKFRILDAAVHDTFTRKYCSGFRTRSIKLIRTIRHNHKVFAESVSKIFGERRFGDQIGALLAGAYSLKSQDIITPESAEELIKSQNWDFQDDNKLETDQRRCINHLIEHIVMVDIDDRMRPKTLGALIKTVREKNNYTEHQVSQKTAVETLAMYGLKVMDNDYLMIANSHSQLAKIYRDTDWPQKWNDVMRRFPFTISYNPKRYNGELSRGLGIPLSVIFGECNET